MFTTGTFPTPDGRARFHVPESRPPADAVTAEFPLVLTTGRVKDQWHTRTRTGKVAKLNKSVPAPYVEIHEQDARALGIRHGQLVRVRSRRGVVEVAAQLSKAIRPGTVFAPFHWGALWNARSVVNLATSEAFDPRSKEPELKFAAVRLEPV